jgi:hypothetical protein
VCRALISAIRTIAGNRLMKRLHDELSMQNRRRPTFRVVMDPPATHCRRAAEPAMTMVERVAQLLIRKFTIDRQVLAIVNLVRRSTMI